MFFCCVLHPCGRHFGESQVRDEHLITHTAATKAVSVCDRVAVQHRGRVDTLSFTAIAMFSIAVPFLQQSIHSCAKPAFAAQDFDKAYMKAASHPDAAIPIAARVSPDSSMLTARAVFRHDIFNLTALAIVNTLNFWYLLYGHGAVSPLHGVLWLPCNTPHP